MADELVKRLQAQWDTLRNLVSLAEGTNKSLAALVGQVDQLRAVIHEHLQEHAEPLRRKLFATQAEAYNVLAEEARGLSPEEVEALRTKYEGSPDGVNDTVALTLAIRSGLQKGQYLDGTDPREWLIRRAEDPNGDRDDG